MTLKVGLLVEALSTDVAGVAFDLGVNPLVGREAGGPGEGLQADLADVGSNTRLVRDQVLIQGVLLTEGAATAGLGATEVTLPCRKGKERLAGSFHIPHR